VAMHRDPHLDALNGTTLTPLVRAALDDETAEPLRWHWSPIGYDVYLPGRTLVRFTGTAAVGGSVQPWSMVLKRTSPVQGGDAVSSGGWKREAEAYASGLLADIPGPLRAPQALAVTEDADGSTWLWLEDVADRFEGQWPLAQYGRAAYHLGQFNGVYLGQRPLPTFPWLAPHWADHQGEPAQVPTALSTINRFTAEGQGQHAFPAPLLDHAARLLHDQSLFRGIVARLPQTLCHHDAAQANLLAHQRANGRIETVAIDWESIGHGTVGAEIATLVFGTMRRGTFPARRATALDRVCFAGYLQGLRVAGWRGDGEVVRLGYTAAVALRWSLLMGTLRALTDAGARSRLVHLLKMSEEQGMEHLTLLSMFLLHCADEARMLARRFISAHD